MRYTNFENQYRAFILFLMPQTFVFFQVVSFVPSSRTLLLFLANSTDAVKDHLSGLQKHRISCFLLVVRSISGFFLSRVLGPQPLALWIDNSHEVYSSLLGAGFQN